MGLSKENTRDFHVTLYAGELYTVTLLKRNADLQEGIVTAFTLFDCRKSRIIRQQEPLQGDMSAASRTQWHIPVVQLNRVGVKFLSPLDRIVDMEAGYPRHWMPEAANEIRLQLFENWYTFDTVLVNPPNTNYGQP